MSRKPGGTQLPKPSRSLRFRLDESSNWRVSLGSSAGEFVVSTDVLVLLQQLASCAGRDATLDSLREAVGVELEATRKQLPTGAQLTALLSDLESAGAVVGTSGAGNIRGGLADGFGDPWIQWAMLADSKRMTSYFSALRDEVLPGKSIVLDVGSGTGVLSAWALCLGSRHVHAVEETAIAADIANLVKGAVGGSALSRFTIHPCNSQDLVIPRGVTIVVSELFGNDPFQEGVVPTLRDLAARLGSDNVTYVPQAVSVFAEIIDVLEPVMARRIHTWQQATVSGRKSGLKLPTEKPDVQKFLSLFLGESVRMLDFSTVSYAWNPGLSGYRKCSKASRLGRVRLSPPPEDLGFSGERQILVSRASRPRVPALLLWFRIQLREGITISSHPGEADTCDHWSPLIVPLHTWEATGDADLTVSFGLDEQETRLMVRVTHGKQVLGAR